MAMGNACICFIELRRCWLTSTDRNRPQLKEQGRGQARGQAPLFTRQHLTCRRWRSTMKGYLTVTLKRLRDHFKLEKLVPLAPLSSWLNGTIGDKPGPPGGPSEVSTSPGGSRTLSPPRSNPSLAPHRISRLLKRS